MLLIKYRSHKHCREYDFNCKRITRLFYRNKQDINPQSSFVVGKIKMFVNFVELIQSSQFGHLAFDSQQMILEIKRIFSLKAVGT